MSAQPKTAYTGLPGNLKTSVYWIPRIYRTNPLSHRPGGCEVVVEYHSGEVRGYDWVKSPSAYIYTVFLKDIDVPTWAFRSIDEHEQLIAVKGVIKSIHARKWTTKEEYETESFKEVWVSQQAKELPWKFLKEFDEPDELPVNTSPS